MWTLVFNPSLITYDYHTSYTWKDLDRKIKKNKRVKEFREAVWYKDPKYKEWEYIGNLWNYKIFVGSDNWHKYIKDTE